MPKTPKPLAFEKIGPNLYRTESRSEPGTWYNVAFVGEGRAMCCCYAAIRRGQNGCAHAQALLAHATYEEPKHTAIARPGGEHESNFVVECSCGHRSNIATFDPAYAEKSARDHEYLYSDEAKAERLRRIFE